jgi:polyhydroxybutyrate depolymerase
MDRAFLWIGLALLVLLPNSALAKTSFETDPSLIPMVTDLNKLVPAGRYRAVIKCGDYKRKFIFVTPLGFKIGRPLPIVFFLHGAGGNAEQAYQTYGWAEKADAKHFFAVFPEGLGANPHEKTQFVRNPNVWRDGREAMPGNDVDDSQFFQQLLTELEACLPIDPQRIFVTGFSNGGGMTFTLGSQFSDRIAAIAPVASQSFVSVTSLIRPLPIYYLVGNADPLIPYRGGTVTLPWGTTVIMPSIQRTVDHWVHLDGCSTEPQVISDSHGVFVAGYGADPKKLDILFTTIDGNGHHWPGTQEPLPTEISGPCRDPFNATDAIWNFFEQHPLASNR